MKKKMVLCMLACCLLLTGCNSAFAENEYDSDKKIAESADRYAKAGSVFNPIDGGYSLTVSKFDGRQTLWKDTLDEAQDVEVEITFTLTGGQGKVVHIDGEDKVTTLLEGTADTLTGETVTKNISMTKGQNRLKFVGYDCEDVELEVLFSVED